MTMESFWGVEHGEVISKQDQTDVKDRFKGGNNSGRTALFGTNANAKSDYFERGRKKGKKNDPLASTIGKSYWGVDHGEIAKSDKARRHIGASTTAGTIHPLVGAGHAAYKGKKHRKLGAAATSGFSSAAGSTLGILGAAGLTRGRSKRAMYAGALGGGMTGSYMGAVNNVQNNRIKGLRGEKYPMSRSKKR